MAKSDIGTPLGADEHGGALEIRWYIDNGNCNSVCTRYGYTKDQTGQVIKWDYVRNNHEGTMNYTITGSKVENQ